MSDQLLPDFDGPQQSEQPSPRKPRPRPTRRPTKKKAKRAAPAPKSAKRVPKKRRVRKMPKQVALGVTPGVDAMWSGKSSEALGMLMQLPIEARKLVMTVAQALTK